MENTISVQPQILVVDDSSFSRILVNRELNALGIDASQIRHAASGEEAIAQMKDTTFDLYILDIVMAGMDGLELLRELKKLQPAAKVIMCSGSNPDELVDDLIDLGIAAFISKPFKPTSLKYALCRALSIQQDRCVGQPEYWLAKCHSCDQEMVEVNAIQTVSFICPNKCMRIGPLPAALISQTELENDYQRAKQKK